MSHTHCLFYRRVDGNLNTRRGYSRTGLESDEDVDVPTETTENAVEWAEEHQEAGFIDNFLGLFFYVMGLL